jgi:hypothetical protein
VLGAARPGIDHEGAITLSAVDTALSDAAGAAVEAAPGDPAEMDVLHGLMTTTELTSGQWPTCVAIGSAVLRVGELVRIVLRRADRPSPP